MFNLELEILCESKIDRDWAVVRLKSEKERLGILPFTYIKVCVIYRFFQNKNSAGCKKIRIDNGSGFLSGN